MTALPECKAVMGIRRNAGILELLFDFVITFKPGGKIFSMVPGTVHRSMVPDTVHRPDELLDVNAIKGSTIGAEVCEQLNWYMMRET